MPSFAVDIEFEVFCSCGEPMCNRSETDHSNRMGHGNVVTVEACPSCIARAENSADRDGYERAEKDLLPQIRDLEDQVRELRKEIEILST